MKRLLFRLLWCPTVVLSRDGTLYDDGGIQLRLLFPEPGGEWLPHIFPHIDVAMKVGVAADAVRASPFSIVVCYHGGGRLAQLPTETAPSVPVMQSQTKCDPLLNAGSGSSSISDTFDVSPIDETGLAVVTVWVQSKHDFISPTSALGRPSRVYLWNDPVIAGRSLLGALNQRVGIPGSDGVGVELEGTTAELQAHLGVARSQEAAAWLRRAATTAGVGGSFAQSTLGKTLSGVREVSLVAMQLAVDAQGEIEGLSRDTVTSKASSALERVALVTISNSGYTDYTINAMATLRIKCGMPCVLRTVCLDPGCLATLRASSETADCPGTVTLVTKNSSGFKKEGEGDTVLSEFSNYRTVAFNTITRFKFVVIHELLLTHEFVLFADGDIAFLRPDFLDYLVSYMDLQTKLDVAVQCDLMVKIIIDIYI